MTTVVGHQPSWYNNNHLNNHFDSAYLSPSSSSSSEYDLEEFVDLDQLDMSLRRSSRLSKLSDLRDDTDDDGYGSRRLHYSGGSVTIASEESSQESFQEDSYQESPPSPKVCLPLGKFKTNVYKRANS